MAALAEARAPWAIAWPCVHEFIAVVTNPRIYVPPTPLGKAIRQVDAWLESPSLVLLNEGEGYWQILRSFIADGQVRGGMVHDARVAAICVQHGVQELWSVDRDFSRFKGFRVVNPLV